MKYRWDDFTSREIEKILNGSRKAGAILPLGCTEQHGPYLPINCDTVIAHGAARNLAMNINNLNMDYLSFVLPDFAFTPTPGAENLPGTISVSFDVLGKGLADIIKGVIENGLDFMVIMNGHAQNIGRAIESSMMAAQGQFGKNFPVLVLNAYDFPAIFNKHNLTPSSHAGEAEVALYEYYSGNKIEIIEVNWDSSLKQKPSSIYGLDIRDRSYEGILSMGPVNIKNASSVNKEIGMEIDLNIKDRVLNDLDIYFRDWVK